MDDECDITLTASPDPADVQIGHMRYSLQKKLGIVSHFSAVRRHLKRGGVYVVDVDIPKPSVRAIGEWGRRTRSLPEGYVETWYEDFPDHLTLHYFLVLIAS